MLCLKFRVDKLKACLIAKLWGHSFSRGQIDRRRKTEGICKQYSVSKVL